MDQALPLREPALEAFQLTVRRATAIGSQSEVRWLWNGCFDLGANLIQDCRDALGCENAGDGDLVFSDSVLSRRMDRVQKRVLVVAVQDLPETSERRGRRNGVTRGISHATRDN